LEQEEIDKTIRDRLSRQREKHDGELQAKGAEVQMLEKRVKELTKQASSLTELETELTSLRSKVQRSDRLEVMRGNSIPVEAIDDISAIYESRMTGLTDEDRQTWSSFLGEEGMARKIVLLQPYFNPETDNSLGVASVSPSGAVSTDAVEPTLPGLPSGNTGVTPSLAGKTKMTAQDLSRYFQSNEYRSLKPDEQKAKLTELKSSYS